MEGSCHICGVAVGGDGTGDDSAGFECADCGELTCPDCKSIGVARETDHCQQCRG